MIYTITCVIVCVLLWCVVYVIVIIIESHIQLYYRAISVVNTFICTFAQGAPLLRDQERRQGRLEFWCLSNKLRILLMFILTPLLFLPVLIVPYLLVSNSLDYTVQYSSHVTRLVKFGMHVITLRVKLIDNRTQSPSINCLYATVFMPSHAETNG